MKRVFLVAIALYLAACATEAGYREIVESWIGARESDLVASVWGPPLRVYEIAGGTRILTYTKDEPAAAISPMVGIGTAIGSGGGGFISTGIGGTTGGEGRFCETSFTVDNGIITAVSFQGDGCTA